MPKIKIPDHINGRHFVMDGKAMRKIFSRIKIFAEYADTILIVGETGVGKDLIAHEIHRLSDRKYKPLMRVPLSSFSDTLLE